MATTISSGRVINRVDNTKSDKVIITYDKLFRKLTPHIENIHRKREWVSALGLMLATLTTLITCDFKYFIFSGEVWNAVFLLGFVISFVYFIYSVAVAIKYRKENTEAIIKDIMTKD